MGQCVRRTVVTQCQVGGRRGFSLVEVLVAVAIIGLLVAFAIPAVQSARERARRTECQNHLKQWGLAMHNHHDTQGKFPIGARNNPRQTWVMSLWSHIEQGNLDAKNDFTKPFHDPPGTIHGTMNGLCGARVPIYCQTPGQTISGPYGTTNVWDNIDDGQFISDAYVYTGYEGGLPTAWYLSEIANAASKAGAPDDYVDMLRARPTRTATA